MLPHAVRHTLAPVLAVTAVVAGLSGLTAGVTGLVDPAEPAASPRVASAALTLAPGGQQVVAWSGSARRSGVSFTVPDAGARLTVGLQLASDRRGRSGYRASLTLSPAGRATEVVARVRGSRAHVLRRTRLPGTWAAGDVVRLETRVGGSRGRVVVRARATSGSGSSSSTSSSSGGRWVRGVDRGRVQPTGRRVLALGALGGAAPGPVTLRLAALDATYGTETPTPTSTMSSTPSGPSVPSVPSDAFGPIGDPISGSDFATLGFDGVQAPEPERITVLPDGTELGPDQPAGPIWRALAKAGELYTDGRSRSEVYGRRASPWSTPADQWPDPPGAERWFTFSVFVPAAFPVATDTTWFDLTQWKGYHGGSPPIALEIKRSRWRLGGSRSNDGLIDQDDIGPIVFGAWTRFTVGLHYSTSATDGWVQVFRNGKEVLPRTAVATMDTYQGQPDPVYLKQGIYRSTGWKVDQALYFSPVQVSTMQPVAP